MEQSSLSVRAPISASFLSFSSPPTPIFWLCHVACRILVPPSGIKPVPPAVEAQILNHWTTREVPLLFCLGWATLHTRSQLPTRDQTHHPAVHVQWLSHWTSWEVPFCLFSLSPSSLFCLLETLGFPFPNTSTPRHAEKNDQTKSIPQRSQVVFCFSALDLLGS